MGIILRVIRLEVSVYNFYVTKREGGGGGKSLYRLAGIVRRKNLKTFFPITSKNSASVCVLECFYERFDWNLEACLLLAVSVDKHVVCIFK